MYLIEQENFILKIFIFYTYFVYYYILNITSKGF